MYDLSFQKDRERLAATITAEVEADTVAEYAEDYRWHLGASIMGHSCDRYLWNVFRWLGKEKLDGQKMRLFKRGHFEEPKFVHRLKRIGFEIFEVDGDGKQYKIAGHNGHYGGSLDSVGVAPERYGLREPLLVEFKTHGDKYFTELAGKAVSRQPFKRVNPGGVRKAKPEHFSQMCSYGQAYGLKYALYCAINKNTDELYFEVVALDFSHGVNLYDRAGRIIFAPEPPKKVSNSISYFECKMCEFAEQCHTGKAPDKNCRSCEHAMPAEKGEWYCRLAADIIPRDFVPLGCDSWRRIV